MKKASNNKTTRVVQVPAVQLHLIRNDNIMIRVTVRLLTLLTLVTLMALTTIMTLEKTQDKFDEKITPIYALNKLITLIAMITLDIIMMRLTYDNMIQKAKWT